MENIIEPIDRELLKAELSKEKKLRDTNKGGNEIYIVTCNDAPNVLKEIGRLREISFRASGGGTGLSMDIDYFDTMENPCRQLILWDPDAEKIIGGYRFLLGTDMKFSEDGQPVLATSHLFRFSEKFIKEYLPYTIELGRSFISPEYQRKEAGTKALFALDNLWDGLGALMIQTPGMKYFFGKMTMYPSYDSYGRDLILHFLDKHFSDDENLVVPHNQLPIKTDSHIMDEVLTEKEFKDDYRLLNAEIRRLGYNIPPLVNSYMSLSPTMKMFGTAINDEFGDVEETGILIAFDEMYDEKKERHIDSFIRQKIDAIKRRFPDVADGVNELAERIRARRGRVHARRETVKDRFRKKHIR